MGSSSSSEDSSDLSDVDMAELLRAGDQGGKVCTADVQVTLRHRRSTREVIKFPRMQFTEGKRAYIGSGTSSHMVVSDPRVASRHLELFTTSEGGLLVRCLPNAKSYILIGQGRMCSGKHKLETGAVVKLGGCCLQVMEVVNKAAGAAKEKEAKAAEEEAADGSDTAMTTARAAGDEETCYICLEGSRPDDPVVKSPCPCTAHVHRGCLETWLSHAEPRVRSCGICKSHIAVGAFCKAPYIVLHLIRHGTGVRWTWKFNFALSFAEDEGRQAIMGSTAPADIVLPDPTVSRQHALLTYDKASDNFEVQDFTSSAGSFLLMKPQVAHEVAPGHMLFVRIGSALISIVCPKPQWVRTDGALSVDTSSTTASTIASSDELFAISNRLLAPKPRSPRGAPGEGFGGATGAGVAAPAPPTPGTADAPAAATAAAPPVPPAAAATAAADSVPPPPVPTPSTLA